MSKSIFIRNPKCATISIRSALKRHKDLNVRIDELDYHQTAKQWQEQIKDFNDHFVFTVCRNPYERLLSGWLFICRRKLDKHKNILAKYGSDFKLFVRGLKDDFNIDLTDVDMVTWCQREWICDSQGKIIVDEIGRFENLTSWWSQLCKKRGWPKIELVKSNSTNHGHWREYYTPDMIKVVNEQYADDFKLLNYPML